MSNDPLDLARHARRTALVKAVRAQQDMSLTQLFCMVLGSKYADDLGTIRIEELFQDPGVLRVRLSETIDDRVMRVFRRLAGEWVSSQLFARLLGLERWEAQSTCRALAERGRIHRRGNTSGTRYCFEASNADESAGS